MAIVIVSQHITSHNLQNNVQNLFGNVHIHVNMFHIFSTTELDLEYVNYSDTFY